MKPELSEDDFEQFITSAINQLNSACLSIVLDRPVATGDNVVLNRAEHGERMYAVHQALATALARWNHYARRIGVSEELIDRTVEMGIRRAEVINAVDDAMQTPKRDGEKES